MACAVEVSPYSVSRAEPRDAAALRGLLARWVTTEKALARYDWLYLENPQGRAETWLAREPVHGEIVGFTSILPRDFLVRGREVTGGIGFDAFVRPDQRRRGVALRLHEASREDMARGEVPFRFMCGPPVPANLQALLKAGSRVTGRVRYLTLPLSGSGLLSLMQRQADAHSLAFLDPLLRAVRHLLTGRGPSAVVRSVSRIDRGFDRLWERLAPRFDVIGRRDGAYLDWRYRRNPVCDQELLELQSGGERLGWAAVEFAPKGCLLLDWLFAPEGEPAAEALRGLVAAVARRGASRLTLRLNVGGAYSRLFRSRGFLPGRNTDRFQVLCPDPELQADLHDLHGWHFCVGDLNPEASPWSVNTSPQEEWARPGYVGDRWG